MLGRISYVLVIGLLIGMIATGAGVAIAARHEAAPPPARGDLNAPFDLALTITEAFFTEQVNHPQATQPGETVANQSRLRDATVRLRSDGTIEVRGKAPVLGITVPVRAVLMPRIVDNQLQLAIIEGQAGGLGVPDAVVKDIESALNRQLRATLAKNAFQVIALQPGEGTLLIHLK